jgi:phosphoribosylformylglycinamidine (FGAM) synthase PurS component
MKRAVAVNLKIPDNTAYTALVTLRRLGVAVERVERSDVYFFDHEGDEGALAARVKSDETIFNPNTHRLTLLGHDAPRWGEVWIQSLGPAEHHAVAWRLFDANGAPVERRTLAQAVERLLCNPAIDRAVY